LEVQLALKNLLILTPYDLKGFVTTSPEHFPVGAREGWFLGADFKKEIAGRK